MTKVEHTKGGYIIYPNPPKIREKRKGKLKSSLKEVAKKTNEFAKGWILHDSVRGEIERQTGRGSKKKGKISGRYRTKTITISPSGRRTVTYSNGISRGKRKKHRRSSGGYSSRGFGNPFGIDF